MLEAAQAVTEFIAGFSKSIGGKDEIAQVASISAADSEIGETIAEAMEKVGKDGVITVEEGQTFGMELEFTDGMQFDKGFISPYFVTDPDRQEAILEDPYILIVNSKITAVNDLLPVLEKAEYLMFFSELSLLHRLDKKPPPLLCVFSDTDEPCLLV